MNIDKIKTQKINNTKKIELKSDYKNHSDIIQNDSRMLNNSLECLQNYNRTNISFHGTTDNSKKISTFRTETARNFFSEINDISPKKCELLLNCDSIFKDINDNSYAGIFDDRFFELNKDNLKIIKEAILKTPENEIEDAIFLYKKRYPNDEYGGIRLLNSIVIYSTDKDCYKYMMDSPIVKMDTYYSSGYSKDLCEYLCSLPQSAACNLSYPSALLIYDELQKNSNYDDYTSYSDNFNEEKIIKCYKDNKEELEKALSKINKLRNTLSQSINKGDIIAYRGERSSWMFESIPIDKKLEQKTRVIAMLNPKSRKELIFPNNKRFLDFPNESIYKYIKNKDKLTLADAMLVCKYADNNFINEVLKHINSAQIIDNNFKSFTLCSKFAENWAKKSSCCDDKTMLSMVSKTNIKKGNQVGYSGHSKQYEFILNKNDKLMTFSNAKFDKNTNMFTFDSEIKSI